MGKSALQSRGRQLQRMEHKVSDLVKNTQDYLAAIQALAKTSSLTGQSPTAAQRTPRSQLSSQSSIQAELTSESKTTTQQQSATSSSAQKQLAEQELRRLFDKKLRLSLEAINSPEEGGQIDQIAGLGTIDAKIESICTTSPSLSTLRMELDLAVKNACKNERALIAAEKAIKEQTLDIINHTFDLVSAEKDFVALFHETENLIAEAYKAPSNEQPETTKARENQIKQNLVTIIKNKKIIIENLKATAKLEDQRAESPTTLTVNVSKAVSKKHQTKMHFRRTMFLRSVAATLAGIALLAALASNPAGWVLGVMIAVGTVLAASGLGGMYISTRSKKTSRVAPSDDFGLGDSPAGSSHATERADIAILAPEPRTSVSFAANCCAHLTCGLFRPAETTSRSSKRATGLDRSDRQQRPSM